MMRNTLKMLALAVCLQPCGAAIAQDGPPPPQPIDAKVRHAVVAALDARLKSDYVFPEVAAALGKQLVAKEAAGGYAAAKDTAAFAEALSTDLRELGKDGHFVVEF